MANIQNAPKKWVPVGDWGFSIGVVERVSQLPYRGTFYFLWVKDDTGKSWKLTRFNATNGRIAPLWVRAINEAVTDYLLSKSLAEDLAAALAQVLPKDC